LSYIRSEEGLLKRYTTGTVRNIRTHINNALRPVLKVIRTIGN